MVPAKARIREASDGLTSCSREPGKADVSANIARPVAIKPRDSRQTRECKNEKQQL